MIKFTKFLRFLGPNNVGVEGKGGHMITFYNSSFGVISRFTHFIQVIQPTSLAESWCWCCWCWYCWCCSSDYPMCAGDAGDAMTLLLLLLLVLVLAMLAMLAML